MLLRFTNVTFCLGVSTTCIAALYDIYIAAGHSNMDGRGLKSQLTGFLAQYATVQSDVLLHFTNPRNPHGDLATRPTFSSNSQGFMSHRLFSIRGCWRTK